MNFLSNWYSRFKKPDPLARRSSSSEDGSPSVSSRKSAPSPGGDDFDQFLVSWVSGSRRKLTAPYITRLLEDAENGSPRDQAELFLAILEKEPVIAAHMQTRILAVLGCKWTITQSDQLARRSLPGEDGSDFLKKALSGAGFYALQKHLLSAIYMGYAGSAIVWEPGGGGIRGFVHVHPSNWLFDLTGNPALMGLDGKEHSLGEYHPDQFVFHTHQMKPGIPSTGGLLRALAWLYFFKHYALRDRSRYLERFGMPFVLATISKDDFENDDIRNRILHSLSKMGSDGSGVVTQGSEIKIESPSGSSGGDYDNWFSYIDDIFALLILGQIASSKEAGGLSKGQMQENVRQDILAADCECLMETVNRQIVRPLESFKWGTGSLKFSIDYLPGDDLKAKAEIIKILHESGYIVAMEYIAKTFNMPVKTKPEAPGKSGTSDESGLSDLSDRRGTPGEDGSDFAAREEYFASLTENTLQGLFDGDAMGAFYNPLKAEIKKIFGELNPDDENLENAFRERVAAFFESYPDLYAEMDGLALEKVLSGAMLSAALRGITSKRK